MKRINTVTNAPNYVTTTYDSSAAKGGAEDAVADVLHLSLQLQKIGSLEEMLKR
jgi:hypothetical protein